jgi:pimeloyl-ACP methyl ester carboxylesterase
LSILNQQTVRHQRDKIYEKLAKPGNGYSVYNNKHYQGEIILGEYRVDKVFQDKASGFYALGLVSVSGDNPPVLVVRGFGNWGNLEEFPTEFLPYKDIPDVILAQSDEHFQAAKKVGVIEWLQDKTIKGLKPDVIGQSLGGKIGQQLIVEIPDYIQSLVTFNSIGISLKDFNRYKGKVEIFHYINPADLVPYVLGEKFLPGTIFQVRNPNIKAVDLLGQHNKLVLDNPITLVEEVELETFYWVRELYQSLRNYSVTIQKKVEELSQFPKKEITEYERNLNNSGNSIWRKFENSRQAIQLEFSHIKQAIRQELLGDGNRSRSTQLLKEKVNGSVEVIQKEVESLSNTVQQETNGSGKIFKSFRQTLQQELQDAIETIHQKLDKFLQVETRQQREGKLNKFDAKSDR